MPTSKLTRLTTAQQAEMVHWAKKWIKIGLSTKPADQVTAETSLRAMYSYAGLATPEILWAANPQEMVQLLTGHNTGSAVESTIGNTVHNAVQNAIWKTTWSVVGSAVRDTIGNVVQYAVRSVAIWSAIRDITEDTIWEAYDGGQTQVVWPAMESFYREVCGLELPGNLSARGKTLADYRSSVGPGLWFSKVAILCERPISFEPLTWR